MRWLKNKQEKLEEQLNRKLSNYPCDAYLHNALFFITNGKPEVAYDEICWAIMKSGGTLTAEEEKWRCELAELKGTEE